MTRINNLLKSTVCVLTIGLLSACATKIQPSDYSKFRDANPRSILVLPALNNTGAVEAPEFFLSTISQPFAQRGYYVFPANMVKSLLEENGLSDPSLLYEADATRIDRLFGCDAALYLSIEQWDSKYIVIATTTTVSINYELRSCKSGEKIWETKQALQYSPSSSGSGNVFADIIATAVVSAIEKAAPNYIPLAQQANSLASASENTGIPAGPYLPALYLKDQKSFPSAPK